MVATYNKLRVVHFELSSYQQVKQLSPSTYNALRSCLMNLQAEPTALARRGMFRLMCISCRISLNKNVRVKNIILDK